MQERKILLIELLDGKDWEQKRGLSLPLFKEGVADGHKEEDAAPKNDA